MLTGAWHQRTESSRASAGGCISLYGMSARQAPGCTTPTLVSRAMKFSSFLGNCCAAPLVALALRR